MKRWVRRNNAVPQVSSPRRVLRLPLVIASSSRYRPPMPLNHSRLQSRRLLLAPQQRVGQLLTRIREDVHLSGTRRSLANGKRPVWPEKLKSGA